MTMIGIRRTIRKRWRTISAAARARGVRPGARLPRKAESIRLLGENAKLSKGLSGDVLTAGLSLPAATAGYVDGTTLCGWASDECEAACLVEAGRMGFEEAGNARLWRETLRRGAPDLFHALLTLELAQLQRAAERRGMTPAARLDVTSDIGLAKRYARAFPRIAFYDYTKSKKRALAALDVPNWHVTLSYSGHNLAEALEVLRAGGNVAVVFRARPGRDALPARWRGWRVLDGDQTDARFEDPPGHVVGLTLKGWQAWEDRLETAGVFAQPLGRGRRLPVVC